MAELKRRLSLTIVPWIYVAITTIWFATNRLKEHGTENMRAAVENQPVVACIWHYSLIYFLYHLRRFSATIMISSSRDGDYIARIAELLGLQTVRGSSNRRGVAALKNLIGKLREGSNAGIVADGSQGPPLKVQPGMILLAAKTGRPILPMAWSANRCIRFKSWDRTALPLPFSVINMHYGPLIHVPETLKSEQVEEYRVKLEEELLRLYETAWEQAGKEAH